MAESGQITIIHDLWNLLCDGIGPITYLQIYFHTDLSSTADTNAPTL